MKFHNHVTINTTILRESPTCLYKRASTCLCQYKSQFLKSNGLPYRAGLIDLCSKSIEHREPDTIYGPFHVLYRRAEISISQRRSAEVHLVLSML